MRLRGTGRAFRAFQNQLASVLCPIPSRRARHRLWSERFGRLEASEEAVGCGVSLGHRVCGWPRTLGASCSLDNTRSALEDTVIQQADCWRIGFPIVLPVSLHEMAQETFARHESIDHVALVEHNLITMSVLVLPFACLIPRRYIHKDKLTRSFVAVHACWPQPTAARPRTVGLCNEFNKAVMASGKMMYNS